MSETPGKASRNPVSYPAVFAGLMVLWPIVSLLGAQGMTPLLGLAALAALAYGPLPKPSMLLGLFILLVGWVSLSTAWSPAREGPFISGSLAEGNFAIKVSAFRLAGIALATLLALGAMLSSPAQPRRAGAFIAAIFALHLAMIAITPPLLAPGLSLMYETQIEAQRDGMQNVLRYANALALALPVLLAMAWSRGGATRIAGLAGAIVATLVFAWLGSAAAVLAVILMTACIAIVAALPRNGFRVIFTGLAAMVVAAPGLAHVARLLDSLDLAIPLSFQSRIWAWQAVGEKLAEKPVTGHGLEAASTWRETYATRPEWLADAVARGGVEAAWLRYPLIPSHPHNMPLEVWAETGAIGALLMAGALFALGLRLPSPAEMPARMRIGAAGLTGSALAIASVSYSTWNEAFWASLALASLSLIVVARAERV